MKMRSTVLGFGVVALAVTTVSAQSNWPRFRGDTAGVVADDARLPDTWGPDENVVWSVDVPGQSWSSPIVWDDHVFVVTAVSVDGEDEALAPVESYRARSLGGSMSRTDVYTPTTPIQWALYDIEFGTGAVRWERMLHTGLPGEPTHQKTRMAAETPVTDGERVYVYLGDIGLFALEFDGSIAWSAPMEWLPRRDWGSATSPALHDGRLYVVNDNEAQSYIAAYDAATGAELWRTDRDEASNWATPFVWENDVRTEIVTSGTGGVRSYGLDGELLWELHGMSTLVIPTPFSEARSALYQLRVRRGPIATGLRRSPGCVWRHHARRRQHQQRLHRLVAPAARVVQPVIARLWRLPLHAARPRHPAVLRRADRSRSLSAGPHHGGHALHGVAVGIQREDLCIERGWRHLRHPGRTGVRGPGS